MDRPQNMVVNIAFYENDLYILSLFRTGEFTPATFKSYIAPHNQHPVARKQCPAPCKQRPAPHKQRPAPRKQCPAPRKQCPAPIPHLLEKLANSRLISVKLYGNNILGLVVLAVSDGYLHLCVIVHIFLYFSVYIFAIWKFKYNNHILKLQN